MSSSPNAPSLITEACGFYINELTLQHIEITKFDVMLEF